MKPYDKRIYGRIRDQSAQSNGGKLDFCFMSDSISESVEAEWESVPIIGRSAPIFGYSGTGAKSVGLELTFAAMSDATEEVMTQVQWLQSLKYPEYVGTVMFPPHPILLTIGTFVSLYGFLQSADVSYSGPFETFGPEGTLTLQPMVAKVNITVTELVSVPYDCVAVRDSTTIGAAGTHGFAKEWQDFGVDADLNAAIRGY